MDKIRSEILKKAENQWDVILISCPKSLETKQFFRKEFKLELSDLKDWMTPGKTLLKDNELENAMVLKNSLNNLKVEVDLIQTGISYRGKFSESEILDALYYSPNHSLSDFVISPEAYFHLRDYFILIEDNELATACLKYLLEYGAPIEDR